MMKAHIVALAVAFSLGIYNQPVNALPQGAQPIAIPFQLNQVSNTTDVRTTNKNIRIGNVDLVQNSTGDINFDTAWAPGTNFGNGTGVGVLSLYTTGVITQSAGIQLTNGFNRLLIKYSNDRLSADTHPTVAVSYPDVFQNKGYVCY